MRAIELSADVCVVGGGMSGVCAAVAAARNGAKTVLLHDRPVLGGNASSEIRMWICGAQGLDRAPNRNLLETGIIEEIRLRNMHRNPGGNWSIWDSVTYEIVQEEPNLTLMLNCTCLDAECDGNRIRSVQGWQMTCETRVTVRAEIFIDCSGDSILIPLTGADHRLGRESAAEFGEDIQPSRADKHTMGLSCLIQTRETESPKKYIPPSWANVYETDADLNNRPHDLRSHNFWWLELGGDQDSIHDTELIKTELVKSAFGIWDHIKNRGDHGAENWELEWIGFLAGKRESRRYIGDHVLTQNDIRAEGHFEDVVAYGGWPMDDHHPAGLNYEGDPTCFHEAPAPYGIPYRCLYSRNIGNLMCAGRNISVTHAALSSTRVMATCSVVAQAAGTAAAMAASLGVSPRRIGQEHIHTLQQKLMKDDCYLPWQARRLSELSLRAVIASDAPGAESLRNGVTRVVGDVANAWKAECGDSVTYRWEEVQSLRGLQAVFDSDLNRGAFGKTLATNMPCRYTLDMPEQAPPASLVKGFHVEVLGEDRNWTEVLRVRDNVLRLVRADFAARGSAVRLTVDETWGDARVSVFELEIL